jgi:uncharacterized damage-inducible protein DinB
VEGGWSFPNPEVIMIPTLVEQYRRWFEYEKDSHRQLLASLETVPEEGRLSETFQKALTLMSHMVAARQMWLYRFGGPVERPANLFPTDATYEGVLSELEVIERHWSDYFGRLDEPELERAFDYATSEGMRFRSVVVDVLTQLFSHSFYHRGQIASLVRAAGGEPAKTDFIFWTREAISPTAS